MTDFTQFGLPQNLVDALARLKITAPTPVQAATLPLTIKGSDILASAQTGSGKTIAFCLPLLMKLIGNPGHSALILTPTRELALQVQQTLHSIIGRELPFKTTLLIGGMPMGKQFAELRRRPQLIVGTPGRVNDHLNRGSLDLNNTRFLVIDEADRMLDMGFGIQLDEIAEYLPSTRQTLMFSATMPLNIEKLSKKYLNAPERVTIAASALTAPKIKQEILHMKNSEKFNQLLEQIEKREGSIIVFVKTKRGADRLSRDISDHGHLSDAIHGDLPQRARDRVISGFRDGRHRIMVATDVAARGLDIPHVKHVINFDLPQCPEDYIHRIGRTGRAGAEGSALCLVSPEENTIWRAIAKLIDPDSTQGFMTKSQSSPNAQGKFKPRPRGFSGQSSSFSKQGSNRSPRGEGSFAPRSGFQNSPRKESSFGRSNREGSFGGYGASSARQGNQRSGNRDFSPSRFSR